MDCVLIVLRENNKLVCAVVPKLPELLSLLRTRLRLLHVLLDGATTSQCLRVPQESPKLVPPVNPIHVQKLALRV